MMIRTFLSAAVLSLPVAAAPTLAAASKPECIQIESILDKAVVSRKLGASAEATMETIAGDYSGEEAQFAAMVPMLVDHVWKAVPEDQLTEDLGDAWRAACEAQD